MSLNITMNKSKARPFQTYFYTIAIIIITGLCSSIYLLISHYRIFTDINYRSFCAITQSINCDTVSQSSYSILFGAPVPLWGIIGYVFLLLILVFSLDKRGRPQRFWSIIFFCALGYSLISIYFGYISIFYIRSFCLVCILTYAVNFLTLFFALLIRRRFDRDSYIKAFVKDIHFIHESKKKAFYLFFPLFVSAVFIWIFLPSYWQIPPPPPLSSDISTGHTQDDHPWIGASKPTLTIIEFSDYQCFQCKKMHYYLRTLVQQNPDKLRLVHRHFPIDHRFNPIVKEPFHVGSGEMAVLAIYGATQNKFWPVNDLLFIIATQKRPFNTLEIGEKTGLDYRELALARKDPAILLRLQRDIMDGLKMGIQGTPAFLITGKVYTGQIPPEIIENALK